MLSTALTSRTGIFEFRHLALWGCFAALTSTGALRADDPNHTLLVDDDKVECPTATFTEIQDAVMAAPPGATIHVCPGTYKKAVTITQPLTITADTGSILQPTSASATANNVDFGTPFFALLQVLNTHNVSIDDLTVDGTSAMGSCSGASDYVGVLYQNSSGQLTHMAVRFIMPTASSCFGEGIFVQSQTAHLSQVSVSNGSIHDYKTSGIIADLSGASVKLDSNDVTGPGSSPNLPLNGIQISRGAAGDLSNNIVNNHLDSACTSPPAPSCTADTNLLVFFSDNVSLHNNTAGIADQNVHVDGNNTQMHDNNIYASRGTDNVELFGNNNHAENNSIFNSSSVALRVTGNNNHINGNTFNEAMFGIVATGTSNDISGNHFFNVLFPGDQSSPHKAGLSPLNIGPSVQAR